MSIKLTVNITNTHRSGNVIQSSATVPGGGFSVPANSLVLILFDTTIKANFKGVLV